jgi:hypothetical protein
MSLLLQTLESPCLLCWACFEKHRAFTNALRQCSYKYIVMPNHGEHFSIKNFYTNEPLFSEMTRSVFHARYQLLQSGSHYKVFACY